MEFKANNTKGCVLSDALKVTCKWHFLLNMAQLEANNYRNSSGYINSFENDNSNSFF